MAREYGRLWLSIWSDPDFRSLTSSQQRLYMLLISQPGMNTCGVLSYAPRRWATLAPDTTPRQVEQAVNVLERLRFVVVDRATDELLVRTHVRHDRALRTANVAKSLARTWEQIASAKLKDVVLVEMHRLAIECGDNGWPGWEVAEVKQLLARPSPERSSEWSFEQPPRRASA